jgi:hypothetical protein
MNNNTSPDSWYTLLSVIIKDTYERQRIAKEIQVQPITLQRWVTGESRPREENMRSLLKAIPYTYKKHFRTLIAKDFPAFSSEPDAAIEPLPDIPSTFYAHIFSMYANTASSLYIQELHKLILKQIIEHLDPERDGMSISVTQCVTPRPGIKVRSLREIDTIGTPPWTSEARQHTIFLGAESLAGSAVSTYRIRSIDSRQQGHSLYGAHWVKYEESAIAYPITRKARIAGCLSASSRQEYYFNDTHRNLLRQYAALLALTFEPDAFYDPHDIELVPMPLYHEQELLFLNLQQRVLNKINQSVKQHQLVTPTLAQEQVWQEIEEELINLPPSTKV